MANFTRRAIMDSFMKLLNERPLNKITVKDIVEECGINRNSFYYHFQDIPTLVEQIVTEEAEKIIRDHATVDSLEEGLNVAIQFALENRRAVLHMYNSVNRDIYERYLWRICDYLVDTFFEKAFEGRGMKESDKPILLRYYKCMCFGMIADWTECGLKDDIRVPFKRLLELKHGMVEEMVRRSAES